MGTPDQPSESALAAEVAKFAFEITSRDVLSLGDNTDHVNRKLAEQRTAPQPPEELAEGVPALLLMRIRFSREEFVNIMLSPNNFTWFSHLLEKEGEDWKPKNLTKFTLQQLRSILSAAVQAIDAGGSIPQSEIQEHPKRKKRRK